MRAVASMLRASHSRLVFEGSQVVSVHNPLTVGVNVSVQIHPPQSTFSVHPEEFSLPGGCSKGVVVTFNGGAAGTTANLVVRSGNRDDLAVKIEVAEQAAPGDSPVQADTRVSAAEARVLKQENERLQALVSELRATSPNVARLADLAVRREREAFEDKSKRVLVLMRRKENKIRELGEALRRKGRGAIDICTGNKIEDEHKPSSQKPSGEVKTRERVEELSADVPYAKVELAGYRTGSAGAEAQLRDAQRSPLPTAKAHTSLPGAQRDSVHGDSTTAQLLAAKTRAQQAEEIISTLKDSLARARQALREQGDQLNALSASGEAREMNRRSALALGHHGEGSGGGTTAGEGSEEIRGLYARLADLQASLAAQSDALAKKDLELSHATVARRREMEQSKTKEACLMERVNALERLQRAAQRVMIKGEAQARQKVMWQETKTACNPNPGPGTDSGSSAVAKEGVATMQYTLNLPMADAGLGGHGDRGGGDGDVGMREVEAEREKYKSSGGSRKVSRGNNNGCNRKARAGENYWETPAAGGRRPQYGYVSSPTSHDTCASPSNIDLGRNHDPDPAELGEYLGAQAWWMYLADRLEQMDSAAEDALGSAIADPDAAASAVMDSGGGVNSFTTGLGRNDNEACGPMHKAGRNRNAVGAKDSKAGGGKEGAELRRTIREQAMELVLSRQGSVQAEMDARRRVERSKELLCAVERRVTELEQLLHSEQLAGYSQAMELEHAVSALHARGDPYDALAGAKEELAAEKLMSIRIKGDAELHSLLLEEERRHHATTLAKAEDLQEALDRHAVAATLKGSPDCVTASSLISHFAGTACFHAQQIKDLEGKLQSLQDGYRRHGRPTKGTGAGGVVSNGKTVETRGTSGDGKVGCCVDSGQESSERFEDDEGDTSDEGEWVRALVKATETRREDGRLQALEHEAESLQGDLLSTRREVETLRQELEEERRRRPTDLKQGEETAAMRRKLAMAAGEVEALLVHNQDLRRRELSRGEGAGTGAEEQFVRSIKSCIWGDGSLCEKCGSRRGDGEGDAFGDDGGKWWVSHAANAAAGVVGRSFDQAEAVQVVGRRLFAEGEYDSAGGVSDPELVRLKSLLGERTTQVKVLAATVEALQATSLSSAPAPALSTVSGNCGVGNNTQRGPNRNQKVGREDKNKLERHQQQQQDQQTPQLSTKPLWDSLENLAVGSFDSTWQGGVGILGQLGPQGLVSHCVRLAVRLTAALARTGRAERRADSLLAKNDTREREGRRVEGRVSELESSCQALEADKRRVVAALEAVGRESTARLRAAGEESSQLRRALADAEMRAVDSEQRLEQMRADVMALERRLGEERERCQLRGKALGEEHISRLKECADRLYGCEPGNSVGGSVGTVPVPGRGDYGGDRGGTGAGPAAKQLAGLLAGWWNACHPQRRKRGGVPAGLALNVQNVTEVEAGGDIPERDLGSISKRGVQGGRSGRGVDQDQGQISNHARVRREFRALEVYLQETVMRLDSEGLRAMQRSRALEWELRGVREDMLETTASLEEAQTETERLSARLAVAEAVALASSMTSVPASASSVGLVTAGGGSAIPTPNGSSSNSVAAVSLLEKRLAAAMEDLVAYAGALAASLVEAKEQRSRADQAEEEASIARKQADVLGTEMTRNKVKATEQLQEEAAEWRRNLRAELGRWWQSELVPLHSGVAMDWGNAAAVDDVVTAGSARVVTGVGEAARGDFAGMGTLLGGKVSSELSSGGPAGSSTVRRLVVGITGEEAMAQALIATRTEQSLLEERLLCTERCLDETRAEVMQLEPVVKHWQQAQSVAAMGQHRGQQRAAKHTLGLGPSVSSGADVLPPAGGRVGGACSGCHGCREAGPSNRAEGVMLPLERELMSVTGELVSSRDEVTRLRTEVEALKALAARAQEDEARTRESLGPRLEAVTARLRQRGERDLRDVHERLSEEQERFKRELGIAHAELLRRDAELAETIRRRQELEVSRGKGEFNQAASSGCSDNERDFSYVGKGQQILKGIGKSSGLAAHRGEREDGETSRQGSVSGSSSELPRGESRLDLEGKLHEAQEEREALRRMCNSLAVDLQEAVEAQAEAETVQEGLLEEAATAKSESQKACHALRDTETATRELGRLLDGLQQTERTGGTGGRTSTTLAEANPQLLTSPADGVSYNGKADRFARVMIAAKVAEADLLRRLEEVFSGEAELRHMLRRRDQRIEALKREISTIRGSSTNAVGVTVSSGTSRPTPLSLARPGTAIRGRDGIALGAESGSRGDEGRVVTLKAEETARQLVSKNAEILNLRLELTEAGARGGVGDAAVARARGWMEAVIEGRGNREAGCDSKGRGRGGCAMPPGLAKQMGTGGGECCSCNQLREALQNIRGSREPNLGLLSVTGGGAAVQVPKSVSQQGRGSLFLIPSIEVEHKAAAAAAASATALAASESTPMRANLFSSGAVADGEGGGGGLVDSLNRDQLTSRHDSSLGKKKGSKGGMGESSLSLAAALQTPSPLRLSSSIRSMGLHLGHLEKLATGLPPDGGRLSPSSLDVRSCPSTPSRGQLSGKSGYAFVGHQEEDGSTALVLTALTELRKHVTGLEERAEETERLLEDHRSGREELHEEVLRLRAELIKQQRAYWQATATLRDRYDLAVAEMEKENAREGQTQEGRAGEESIVDGPKVKTRSRTESHQLNTTNNTSSVATADSCDSALEEKEDPFNHSLVSGKVDGISGIRTGSDEGVGCARSRCRQTAQALVVEAEGLRLKVQGLEELSAQLRIELCEVRSVHVQEAQEVQRQLARLVEAQKGQVAAVEQQLKRARTKIKSLGRPKAGGRRSRSNSVMVTGTVSQAAVRGREKEATGLSAEELMGMLATVDEQAFEAKSQVKQLEYELRAKSAEVEMLKRFVPYRDSTRVASGANMGEGDITQDGAVEAQAGPTTMDNIAVKGAGTAMTSEGGGVTLQTVITAARATAAEAEVARLMTEVLTLGEAVQKAQREAFHLQQEVMVTSRRSKSTPKRSTFTASAAGAGASQVQPAVPSQDNKDLQKQVSDLKREVSRFQVSCSTGVPAEGGGRAGREAAIAAAAEMQKVQGELASAREEVSRKGRAIVKLRATQAAGEKALELCRAEVTQLQVKVGRLTRDATAKGSLVRDLRAKRSELESELKREQEKTAAAIVGEGASPSETGEVVRGAHHGRRGEKGGGVAGAGQNVTRDLAAERDRLRAGMRVRQDTLSKQASELETLKAELERLEDQVKVLRATATRKDGAYQAAKSQLAATREEFECFKVSAHRWQADAELRVRQLKRSMGAIANEAKGGIRRGDEAECELAALKSAFRSFLQTLSEDLQARSSPLPASPRQLHPSSVGGMPAEGIDVEGRGSAKDVCDVRRDEAREGCGAVSVAAGEVSQRRGERQSIQSGVSGEGEGGEEAFHPSFTDLTQAEVTDIMRAVDCSRATTPESSSLQLLPPPPPLQPRQLQLQSNPAGVAKSQVSSPPGEMFSWPGGAKAAARSAATVAAATAKGRKETTEEDEVFGARVERALEETDGDALAAALHSLCAQGPRQRPTAEVLHTVGSSMQVRPQEPPPILLPSDREVSLANCGGKLLGSRSDLIGQWKTQSVSSVGNKEPSPTPEWKNWNACQEVEVGRPGNDDGCKEEGGVGKEGGRNRLGDDYLTSLLSPLEEEQEPLEDEGMLSDVVSDKELEDLLGL